MHELDETVCKNASILATAQLMDIRDGKKYWVTKLADKNCWMTQNLDYNGGGIQITNVTTWKTDGSVTNTTAAYYDPGEYYWTPTTPNSTNWKSCGTSGITSLSSCTTADKGNFSTSGSNMHYHIGNYYSWLAATNGSGANAATDGDVADGSICPAGWKLPLSKTTNNAGASFYNLLSQYSLTSAPSSGSNVISNEPLYLFPGGGVWSGTLQNAGISGYYWSSIANNSGRAYYLSFGSTNVNPSQNNDRYIGFSVRCLVQGS